MRRLIQIFAGEMFRIVCTRKDRLCPHGMTEEHGNVRRVQWGYNSFSPRPAPRQLLLSAYHGISVINPFYRGPLGTFTQQGACLVRVCLFRASPPRTSSA